MRVIIFVLLAILALVAKAQITAGECAMKCNDMRTEVLTMEMCREAKRTLPRPKVGDFCSTAMEQGFSDVCVAMCMGQTPVARVAQTCRSAALEMPRPTVRKWCEHGYQVAYDKSLKDLPSKFEVINANAAQAIVDKDTRDFLKAQKQRGDREAAAANAAAAAAAADSAAAAAAAAAAPARGLAAAAPAAASSTTTTTTTKKVIATIPVTLNDKDSFDLKVLEGENVEDSVVVLCREKSASDVAGCIRQLLPDVLERYAAIMEGGSLRGT